MSKSFTRFACPMCGKELNSDDQLVGQVVHCPQCGSRVIVPMTIGGDAATSTELQGSSAPATSSLDPSRRATSAPEPSSNEYAFLAPAQGADEIGRLGSYRVLEVLGSGGMGVVFLAEDLLLRRRVALKVMKSPLGDSESSRESFLREAQTAASVEHENIVPIYQIGEDRGVLFIAMQLLHGETLEQRLQRDKQLGVAAILRIARDTAQGLAAAHAVGLVHRDIKPANLFLVQPTDRVKILDFGLARQAAGGDVNLSDAGGIVGTLAYMSPEQASGRQVDARSDLFSLGCVLYRLCRGAPPFQRATALALLAALANDDPPAPADNSPGMPRPLSDLVMRLLAKEPQERLASAQELLATLQQMQVFALTNVMGVPGASR